MERRSSLFAAVLTAGAALMAAVPMARAQQDVPTVRVSPALPAEGDAVVISADIYVQGNGAATTAAVNDNQIELPVNAQINSLNPYFFQHLEWAVPALKAGAYTVDVSVNGYPDLASALTVRPRASSLGLAGGRFQVRVAAGQPGADPTAVQLSDTGGYYAFFNPENVEITVKLVDGRQVNGRFWVFIASMTDTQFTATVADTSVAGCAAAASCPTRTYTSPAGSNRNFIDVNAF
ncbi:MAG TPA: hypothetical protein VE075_06535 [Thermoanaerobaculia bacterium]|nr:hypothetical protein [Thermoanaerobaculia bacterium]